MVWDLGRAMRKKEEFESARLMDFEFRERARATRLFARALNLDEAELVAETALHDEHGLIARTSQMTGRGEEDLWNTYADCRAEARQALIVERGDPTPYRLG